MPVVELSAPRTASELDEVRAIFREYAAGLGVDLDFQHFDEELAELPGEYAAPRGALVLARVDGELAGCCGLRPLDTSDYANAAVLEYSALGVSPLRLAGVLRWVFTVDTLLAPIGLAIAAAAATSRFAMLLPLPLLVLLGRFSHERTAAISSSLELSRTYRGTALLLGDVVEADDAYTGRHSRAVVDLSIAVAEPRQASRVKTPVTAVLTMPPSPCRHCRS